MHERTLFAVQLYYAAPDQVFSLELEISSDTTIFDVIRQSQVLQQFPEIDLDRMKVGVFGKLKNLDARLNAGDRVEIYRQLKADPMEARRRRARKRV